MELTIALDNTTDEHRVDLLAIPLALYQLQHRARHTVSHMYEQVFLPRYQRQL